MSEVIKDDISPEKNGDANVTPDGLEDPAVRNLLTEFMAAIHFPGKHPERTAIKKVIAKPK